MVNNWQLENFPSSVFSAGKFFSPFLLYVNLCKQLHLKRKLVCWGTKNKICNGEIVHQVTLICHNEMFDGKIFARLNACKVLWKSFGDFDITRRKFSFPVERSHFYVGPLCVNLAKAVHQLGAGSVNFIKIFTSVCQFAGFNYDSIITMYQQKAKRIFFMWCNFFCTLDSRISKKIKNLCEMSKSNACKMVVHTIQHLLNRRKKQRQINYKVIMNREVE